MPSSVYPIPPSQEVIDHLTDAADSHDATAISFTPAGTIAATDVQAAIEEVASEAGAHPDLATHDALGLATDSELTTHAADTTAVHGIADTSVLSTTAHDHDADYEAAGGIATHSADSTAVHGIADTAALSLTSHDHDADYEAAGGIATHTADTSSVHGITDTTVLATDAEVATAVSDHAAAANPHPTYETAAEVLAQIGTHEGLANPHPGYLTPAEGDAAYEATGAVATHAGLADPHTGYRLESADHSHATTGLQGGTVAHTALTSVGVNDHHAQAHTHPAEGAVVVTHASTTGQGVNDHHAQVHAADHLPTGTDPVNKFSQAGIGTADLAIANTETVVVAKTFAAAELTAGMTFMFKAYATRAGTTSASPIIRIRIGTTTLTGNIAATLTPPVNTLAVGNSIEGMVTIRSAGAGGTALGSLMHTVHLAAVTITESLGVSTATVAVDTTAANQKVELTFISGNAANTYTWRNAVIYRVA